MNEDDRIESKRQVTKWQVTYGIVTVEELADMYAWHVGEQLGQAEIETTNRAIIREIDYNNI